MVWLGCCQQTSCKFGFSCWFVVQIWAPVTWSDELEICLLVKKADLDLMSLKKMSGTNNLANKLTGVQIGRWKFVILGKLVNFFDKKNEMHKFFISKLKLKRRMFSTVQLQHLAKQ